MITNSSITNLVIDQNERSIKFTVTGLNETRGFCNATIPKNLLDGTPIILVDGNQVDVELREDSSNYYAYFTYNHSSHDVEIYGSNTIPELHHVTITFSIAALTLCLLMRKHFTKKSKKRGMG